MYRERKNSRPRLDSNSGHLVQIRACYLLDNCDCRETKENMLTKFCCNLNYHVKLDTKFCVPTTNKREDVSKVLEKFRVWKGRSIVVLNQLIITIG